MASKFGGKNKKVDYTRATRPPKSWSYTRYSVGAGCLLKYALKFIHKLKEPDSYALERGIEAHSQAEGYLKGTISGLPDVLHTFEQEFRTIKKLGAVAEESWVVTKTWQPTEWDDWDNAWLRTKIDAHILGDDDLDIIDFKTGKPRDSHEEQAELYALVGLCIHKQVKDITVEFWYLDSGEVQEFTYRRDQLRTLKARWRKAIKPILEARRFPAQPDEDACRWCSFRSDKKLASGEAGPCDGWREV